jgi:hypothetical protein
MNLRLRMQQIFERMCNYNIFIHEEEEYGDDNERRDPATVITHQRYATRLYVLILICK